MSAHIFDRSKAVEPCSFPLGSRAFEQIERGCSPAHEAARLRIEQMLARYPSDEVQTLLTRLRDHAASQSTDAFFELFVLDLFVRQGYKLVGVEQPMPHTSYVVDFSFEAPDGQPFLVEVVSYNPPRELLGPQKLVEEVCNVLDSIVSEQFQVEVCEVSGVPAHSVPKRVIKAKVARWLDSLELANVDGRTQQFEVVSGFNLTLAPKPRDPSGRSGLLVAAPRSTYVHNVVEGIRRKLYQKAYKYGPLSVPLVIALNVSSEIGATAELFDEAVYGATMPDDAFIGPGQLAGPVEYTGAYVPTAGALLEAQGPLAQIPAVLGFLGVDPFNVSLDQGAVYYGRAAPEFSLAPLSLRTFCAPAELNDVAEERKYG